MRKDIKSLTQTNGNQGVTHSCRAAQMSNVCIYFKPRKN